MEYERDQTYFTAFNMVTICQHSSVCKRPKYANFFRFQYQFLVLMVKWGGIYVINPNLSIILFHLFPFHVSTLFLSVWKETATELQSPHQKVSENRIQMKKECSEPHLTRLDCKKVRILLFQPDVSSSEWCGHCKKQCHCYKKNSDMTKEMTEERVKQLKDIMTKGQKTC